MIKITHGAPKHQFFVIAQPPSAAVPTTKILDPDYVKPIYELEDPRSKEKFSAELNGIWTFNLSDTDLANELSLLAYGFEAKKIFNEMCRRYPEIQQTQKIRFLLLKKL